MDPKKLLDLLPSLRAQGITAMTFSETGNVTGFQAMPPEPNLDRDWGVQDLAVNVDDVQSRLR